MNGRMIAAIIKKFGKSLPSGGYELFIPLGDIAAIPPNRMVREFADNNRKGFILYLSDNPVVIDVKATIVPTESLSPPIESPPLLPAQV